MSLAVELCALQNTAGIFDTQNRATLDGGTCFVQDEASRPAIEDEVPRVYLVKERADFFVAFPGANSLYLVQVIGTLEGACVDNALRDDRANPGHILELGE